MSSEKGSTLKGTNLLPFSPFKVDPFHTRSESFPFKVDPFHKEANVFLFKVDPFHKRSRFIPFKVDPFHKEGKPMLNSPVHCAIHNKEIFAMCAQ